MINKVEERKSDLRNTTVMEVILAVIIVLLCFIYLKDQDLFAIKDSVAILENKISEQSQKIKILEIENTELKKENRRLEKELSDAKTRIKQLKLMISSHPDGDAKNRLDDLTTKVNELKSEIEKLRKENKNLKQKNQKLIADNKVLTAVNKALALAAKDKEELLKYIAQLELDIAALEEELQEIKGPADGKGEGLPRCEVSGEPNRIGQIKKSTQGLFSFSPRGNTAFQRQALQIPGVKDLMRDSPFTMQQFERSATKVLNHGSKQVPACLYVMGIDPNSAISLGELQKIEQYFYKDVRK
jgi:hypothetical protein